MAESENASRSVIAADVEIEGTIQTSGSIQIDGRVEGEVITQGDVLLGKSGTVKGNLDVNSVSVAGTIQGNISAKDRIELKSTARMMGDIKAKRLAVEDGVTFVGRSEVNSTGEPVKPAAAGKPEGQKPEEPKGPQSGGQGGGQGGGPGGGHSGGPGGSERDRK